MALCVLFSAFPSNLPSYMLRAASNRCSLSLFFLCLRERNWSCIATASDSRAHFDEALRPPRRIGPPRGQWRSSGAKAMIYPHRPARPLAATSTDAGSRSDRPCSVPHLLGRWRRHEYSTATVHGSRRSMQRSSSSIACSRSSMAAAAGRRQIQQEHSCRHSRRSCAGAGAWQVSPYSYASR